MDPEKLVSRLVEQLRASHQRELTLRSALAWIAGASSLKTQKPATIDGACELFGDINRMADRTLHVTDPAHIDFLIKITTPTPNGESNGQH